MPPPDLPPLSPYATPAIERVVPPLPEAAHAVGEPTVTLTPERTRLVLGTVADISVELDVTGPDAAGFRPVRALATVGDLELPRPTDRPGAFEARYRLPPERYPQVALLVVEIANGTRRALAEARIALDGSTVVPFRATAGAAVTLQVGSRIFGPVTANRRGRADVPVEVPPGVRTGLARAVDRSAAARETEVDLQLPTFSRIAMIAPAELEAGSLAEVAVLAVEEDGDASAPGGLDLTASEALVHPLGAGPAGEARFLLETPRKIGPGLMLLTASAPGSRPARAEARLPIAPAKAAQLVLIPSRRRLVVGAPDVATVTVAARDRFGNLTPFSGVRVRVDGQPRPLGPGPAGTAVLTVPAPVRYLGRDRIDVEAELGTLWSTEQIRLTGGVPAEMTLEVRDARLVGDGQRSTELHVRAMDANGTPTAVPGLSWETPDGHIRRVRVPREGEYVAEYVPDRTREPRRETVAVMSSRGLRAAGVIEVVPAPVRLAAAARAGVYSNLGHLTGTSVFLEALRPLEIRRLRFQAGLAGGYLHADFGAGGPPSLGPSSVEIDQIAVLALARGRIALPHRIEGAADVGLGFAWAATRLGAPRDSGAIDGSASAPALQSGLELGLPLKPGHLVVGLRFLWIELGKTSQGDVLAGNSAGLIGDVGYKMAF